MLLVSLLALVATAPAPAKPVSAAPTVPDLAIVDVDSPDMLLGLAGQVTRSLVAGAAAQKLTTIGPDELRKSLDDKQAVVEVRSLISNGNKPAKKIRESEKIPGQMESVGTANASTNTSFVIKTEIKYERSCVMICDMSSLPKQGPFSINAGFQAKSCTVSGLLRRILLNCLLMVSVYRISQWTLGLISSLHRLVGFLAILRANR
jgi:hypothetical protein